MTGRVVVANGCAGVTTSVSRGKIGHYVTFCCSKRHRWLTSNDGHGNIFDDHARSAITDCVTVVKEARASHAGFANGMDVEALINAYHRAIRIVKYVLSGKRMLPFYYVR